MGIKIFFCWFDWEIWELPYMDYAICSVLCPMKCW